MLIGRLQENSVRGFQSGDIIRQGRNIPVIGEGACELDE